MKEAKSKDRFFFRPILLKYERCIQKSGSGEGFRYQKGRQLECTARSTELYRGGDFLPIKIQALTSQCLRQKVPQQERETQNK